jgi:tetratricopeptide (TPR) repeat protein
VRPPAPASLLVALALGGCVRPSPEVQPPSAKLLTGVGSVHHQIATKNPEAQKYFDQGMALVYGFNFGEALNSFHHAAELDPTSCMPYWGIALAQGPNYNSHHVHGKRREAGFDSVQTALGMSAGARESERAYVEALALLFPSDEAGDEVASPRSYANAMRVVYHNHPDDPDAAVLFAASLMNINPWHLWTITGQPGPDTNEIVSVLEDALRRWPDHLGANHFYIHTMEAAPHPERALPSARILGTLAPTAGHLVHMPSHIYLRTGEYEAAVKSNQAGIAADEEYERQQPNLPPGAKGYFSHNFLFLAVAANMEGDFAAAEGAAAKIGSNSMEHMMVMPLTVLVRFARWSDVLAHHEPEESRHGVRFFWRYARSCSFSALGKLKEAEEERAAMEREFADLPPGRAFGTLFNDWSTLHEIARDAIDGRLAEARGEMGASINYWRAAIKVQDQLNFDDVPDWYYPVRESLGAVLLRSGRPEQAEAVFREDLRHTPSNPRSFWGLSKALEAQKKSPEALQQYAAFAAVWKGKDPPRIEDF